METQKARVSGLERPGYLRNSEVSLISEGQRKDRFSLYIPYQI